MDAPFAQRIFQRIHKRARRFKIRIAYRKIDDVFAESARRFLLPVQIGKEIRREFR
jgi:hypothetical protein